MYLANWQGGNSIKLREQLLKEQARLAQVIEKTKKELENVPEGRLRISKSQGCTQYYHCSKDTSNNGVYLQKNKIKMAKQLAQKSYNEKVLRYSEKTYMQLTRLLQNYQDEKLEQIYYSEHIEKQKLIEPIEETYEQKLEKWLLQEYKGKGFIEDATDIRTNNGLRVRSKSEKIMADYFEVIGLQFKYECPLRLNPYGIVYPDFTFLSRKTGEEIYWEHEGMLDNPEYAKSAVKKIELYEKNRIFPGENLILTFETSASAINTKLMKDIVHRYLL